MPPAVYERVVVKNSPVYQYMKVSLVLEKAQTKLTAVEFKHLITTGLKSLYGEVGAAFPFDLLTFEEDTLTAVLRIYSRGLVRLWSSLTLLGFFQQQRCAFRVLQVSPYLLALTGNSRDLALDP
ncbi:ribonuclease P protein subunit p14 [Gadus morhua]|uniref:ribonuclease P protein subunit p14 n=1 Tax=Gadus morhua TaxID=8049 RepID=UPI0011B75045|nr:ribonuclease P protein subunit p14 [Gadus morhua]